jgi:phosphoribosylanthranilate isomerase
MFNVKICGVMTPEDAALVAAAGADAVGLNFVAGSPRCLTVEGARLVAQAVPVGVLRVGVFAGLSTPIMREVAAAVGLDAIQLHGHFAGPADRSDPPWRCDELWPLPVIRAVRLDPPDHLPEWLKDDLAAVPDRLATARQWIDAARACGREPAMVLLDASVSGTTAAGQLGGTGKLVDWDAVVANQPLPIPAVLAGGLGPDNVGAAIRATRITRVDTASGVERTAGQKDPDSVLAFVRSAREAIAALQDG